MCEALNHRLFVVNPGGAQVGHSGLKQWLYLPVGGGFLLPCHFLSVPHSCTELLDLVQGGLLIALLTTEHCWPCPICSSSIAQSLALVELFSYCSPASRVYLGWFSGLQLVYFPGFYLSGLPFQIAGQGCVSLLSSFKGLRYRQLAVLLRNLFLHHMFLQLQ